ncbi:histone deacetylase family protein [Alteromonas halophila]|uniref:Deacetylase n=1 Tax=Alteromonas halophila TaxID=516698 RepID=A0A918JJH3_9ALTE|nr:histone deacetylase family protein [Alteromonas halophila]GGW84408.1 deacetylase [Alteromonas halophila]
MTVCIFRGNTGSRHDMGPDHPESPDRLHAIDDQLLASGLDMVCEHAEAATASQQQLNLAHDKAYIERIFARAPEEGTVWLDGDTAMNSHTLTAALQAAGAGCDAVDWVLQSNDRQAFCAVRPPGHHAEHNAAMGFCFFNNIAVAAHHAMNAHGLSRIAIVDFDVHHGNGTEDIVAGDERILFCSAFQHPFYPHKGVPASADNIIATPLAAGTNGATFREAVAPWFDAVAAFKPELILVSAGFDGHAEDPMAYWRLREDDYKWISARIRELANRCCHGRIVSMLEGGYDLSALGRSVVAHIKGMSGDCAENGGA